jgi:hypothetical protein
MDTSFPRAGFPGAGFPRAGAEPLPVLDDLHLALATGTASQTSIQHADAKAAILLTVPMGAVVMAANDLLTSRLAAHTPAAVASIVVLGTLLLTGLAGALWQLGQCLRPRLTGPAGDNRFALPHLAVRTAPPPRTTALEQRDEAWRLATVLAGIAMSKHRAVRASIAWLTLTVVSLSGLICMAGMR